MRPRHLIQGFVGRGTRGSGICLFETSELLKRLGWEISIVKPRRDAFEEGSFLIDLPSLGFPSVPVLLAQHGRPTYSSLPSNSLEVIYSKYCQLVTQISERSPGVIGNAHHGGLPSKVFYEKTIPYAISIHGPELQDLEIRNATPYWSFIHNGFHNASMYFVPSKAAMEYARRLLGNKNFILNYCGVSPRTFTPEGPRIHFKARHNQKVVGYVGALEERKNLELLVETVEMMRQRQRPKVVVVGNGDFKGSLNSLVQERNTEANFVFYGCVPHERIAQVIRSFDVLVVTSNTSAETFSLTGVEAISCGVPVVSTPVGVFSPLEEGIIPADFACVSDGFGAKDFCEALLSVLDRERPDPQAMHHFISETFSVEKSGSRLDQHLTELLEASCPPKVASVAYC